MSDGWVTFWFEGNMYFDFVRSRNDWLRLLKVYSQPGSNYSLDDLKGAKECPREPGQTPKFGFAIECNGDLTLGEWAEKHGMDLDIPRTEPAPEGILLIWDEEGLTDKEGSETMVSCGMEQPGSSQGS